MFLRQGLKPVVRLARTGVLVLLFAVALGNASARGAERVAVVTNSNPTIKAAAEALESRLRSRKIDTNTFVVGGASAGAFDQVINDIRAYSPTRIAVGGIAAAQRLRIAFPDKPIVAFLVPNARDVANELDATANVTLVAADVRPDDLVRWVRQTGGEGRKIAVLCSDRSDVTARALADAGRRAGLRIEPLRADRQNFPQAIDALNTGGYSGVIMLADAAVYNSASVERLLLWGVRRKHPVWTFSPKVVKAGAHAGMWPDVAGVGETAAETMLVGASRSSATGGGIVFADVRKTAINLRTAEIIGIPIRKSEFDGSVEWFGE